jgi:hypothetical protein
MFSKSSEYSPVSGEASTGLAALSKTAASNRIKTAFFSIRIISPGFK